MAPEAYGQQETFDYRGTQRRVHAYRSDSEKRTWSRVSVDHVVRWFLSISVILISKVTQVVYINYEIVAKTAFFEGPY